MAFPLPPVAPQRGDRTTFSSRVDAFLSWLTSFVPLLNSFVAGLNARDVGGANSFVYLFDTAITDADPGPGKMRLNAVMQNTSTAVRLDVLTGGGVDISSTLDALGTVSSNTKGSVRLQKVNDPSVWLLFDVTAVGNPGGYRNLTCSVRASSTNTFANGDSISVFIDRNGDKGDSGGTPTQQQIKDAIGVLDIAHGGTNSTTAAAARLALDVLQTAAVVQVGKSNGFGTRFLSGLAPNIANISPNGANESVSLIIGNNNNNSASAVIQFIRDGQYGAFLGLDTDNKWKVGGYSMGNVAYEIYHQGNFNPANYAALSGATFTGPVYGPSFNSTSDERLKSKFTPITDAQLDALAGIDAQGTFEWLDGSGPSLGAGAQSVGRIVPQAMSTSDEDVHGLQYGPLAFAALLAHLRRYQRETVDLRGRICALEMRR